MSEQETQNYRFLFHLYKDRSEPTCTYCGGARFTSETTIWPKRDIKGESWSFYISAQCIHCTYLNRFIVAYHYDVKAIMMQRDIENQEPIKEFVERVYKNSEDKTNASK